MYGRARIVHVETLAHGVSIVLRNYEQRPMMLHKHVKDTYQQVHSTKAVDSTIHVFDMHSGKHERSSQAARVSSRYSLEYITTTQRRVRARVQFHAIPCTCSLSACQPTISEVKATIHSSSTRHCRQPFIAMAWPSSSKITEYIARSY